MLFYLYGLFCGCSCTSDGFACAGGVVNDEIYVGSISCVGTSSYVFHGLGAGRNMFNSGLYLWMPLLTGMFHSGWGWWILHRRCSCCVFQLQFRFPINTVVAFFLVYIFDWFMRVGLARRRYLIEFDWAHLLQLERRLRVQFQLCQLIFFAHCCVLRSPHSFRCCVRRWKALTEESSHGWWSTDWFSYFVADPFRRTCCRTTFPRDLLTGIFLSQIISTWVTCSYS